MFLKTLWGVGGVFNRQNIEIIKQETVKLLDSKNRILIPAVTLQGAHDLNLLIQSSSSEARAPCLQRAYWCQSNCNSTVETVSLLQVLFLFLKAGGRKKKGDNCIRHIHPVIHLKYRECAVFCRAVICW